MDSLGKNRLAFFFSGGAFEVGVVFSFAGAARFNDDVTGWGPRSSSSEEDDSSSDMLMTERQRCASQRKQNDAMRYDAIRYEKKRIETKRGEKVQFVGQPKRTKWRLKETICFVFKRGKIHLLFI